MFRPAENSAIGAIYGVYVEPAWRNRGLGRAMMKAMIRHAREYARLRVLLLAVTAPNPAARHLYIELGFHPMAWSRAPWFGLRLIEEELLTLVRD